MLGKLACQHCCKSPHHPLGASNEREAAVFPFGIECRQARGYPDPSWYRVELGDHHAVLGGDDVRSNDRRKLVAKPFHPTVGEQRVRFSLVEVSCNPGWLEAS